MIDRATLLKDLQALLPKLEADLRARASDTPSIDMDFKAQHGAALADKRTSSPFLEWREDLITQVGVAWILACVFVRFLEDNDFLDEPLISGPGDRLARARDQQSLYVRAHPTDSDREYLLHVFATVGKLPALGRLYDAHNPLHLLGPSADGAQDLLRFWQRTDPATGALHHDFTDPAADTRFVGDLYQDLSEAARKRFALLQTPVFVEEFILDRTLEPAIQTFGLAAVRMIDPTCGSGHFCLGGFSRLLAHWQRVEPGTNPVELVRRALAAVHGVDLNPFAVAIARFRLLVAALRAAGVARVRSSPAWPLNVFTGDSLLFGPEPGQQVAGELLAASIKGAYRTEDAEDATRVLTQRYHAVVGNPPYITVKDKALNKAYRGRFKSCHRAYSLAVPFFERFFDLAIPGDGTERQPGGYVGKITANSFMKREFGKKLVEEYIRGWDLTHIISTDGAYLPGHGTPTVIVFGRNQPPVAPTVRTLLGIKGEPSKPEDPAKGLVWRAILDQIDRPGSESNFITAGDSLREPFYSHPWSIGGGGAADLKEVLDDQSVDALNEVIHEAGYGAVTREDEAYLVGSAARRSGIPTIHIHEFVTGEDVRDWNSAFPTHAIWPYEPASLEASSNDRLTRFLWPYRASLQSRVAYGITQLERGLSWMEYSMFFRDRYRSNFLITFPEISTHNHFVLERTKRVFSQTAPVIRLPSAATEADHLGILGILNSSTACFWLKQVCFPKGGDHQGSEGARVRITLWDERYAFNSTQVGGLPLPVARPLELARELDRHAQQLQATSPAGLGADATRLTHSGIDQASTEWHRLLARMIGLQEELDWAVYHLYGLTAEPLTLGGTDAVSLALGERAFEIALARQIAAGEEQSEWFVRHGSTPLIEIPATWSGPHRALVERRLRLIATDKSIGLIERPEYKRRWNVTPWADQITAALRTWLLDRLETLSHSVAEPALFSVSELAERTRSDADFQRVAELYTGRPDFDLTALVGDLVAAESVPSLPGQRYKADGLRKRAQWEDTWTKQRSEDAITARITAGKTPAECEDPKLKQAIQSAIKAEVGEIPVPPKYTSADFYPGYWKMRGKLDVPKERWVSYPGAERAVDQTLVLGWAGWDQLQQAKAIAAHYERLKSDGAPEPQLVRLLASLRELIPWLLQWHNQLDPEFQLKIGDYFRTFIDEEARRLHLTAADLQRIATTR
jgi:hypothetical protein